MPSIQKIAQDRRLRLIDDTAEAHAEISNKRVGSFGVDGTFSLVVRPWQLQKKGVALIGLLKAELELVRPGRAAGRALEAVGYLHSRHTISVPNYSRKT
jgi:dTDP-4-amino-4,6-dideoxygalactose transaminase